LVLKGGGKAYIRLRVPKYTNTADGATSIAKEMTMRIPQLGEMAEVLCGGKMPAVISIGKRCLEVGYAFYWPPFSEHPFFVEPDGSRVTMEVEGNILSLGEKSTMLVQPRVRMDLTLTRRKTRTWRVFLVARPLDA
jgi:hypothetical protein